MSTSSEVGRSCLLDPSLRCATGENPLWHEGERRWYWLDLPARAIFRLDPASGSTLQWQVDEHLGCMVPRADGGFTCGCVSGLFDVELPSAGGQALQRLRIAAAHARPDTRFNDGRCDRQGRLWVSGMVMNNTQALAVGCWYRYTPTEGLRCMDSGYVTPNGSAFSPDGRTLYTSDSFRDVCKVWAWDYDPETGLVGGRRCFIDMHGAPGRPDGAAVDTDGCYWICCADGGCIQRYTPQGVLDQVWRTPMLKPTMCAFGGEDMRTLLVTSMCRGPADLATDPEAGRLLMFRPGAQGIVEPRLAP
ncbi:MAG: gluconolactonase [Candidatus Dactylopiibacterium carminicum]|uniref:Gluconolactonase n=1 Tax=Candidatus Dactylopiibacterium carminicum TaxID=857335 RepID=A0A272ETH0_9RHOO|nr:SMP-30/gluconolactonase/LRE family protein [Candidatus Dactylopiibacterium carminicum]KAF7599378.1 gluconolactonase [Candidatus Dactylopiibacterium carminicum]PAS93388.1 MAG: gluconolactonase [Candidatus Dactylopiibacterium carminicum]PAS98341.1 MAG: gluconolactonase [Candidatus Dactylopiibacterium carminicum]PAS99387.1 MAG: gluconolactonase [Candidatus Dactylopiibacterium carminicum]